MDRNFKSKFRISVNTRSNMNTINQTRYASNPISSDVPNFAFDGLAGMGEDGPPQPTKETEASAKVAEVANRILAEAAETARNRLMRQRLAGTGMLAGEEAGKCLISSVLRYSV
jgi:hypothetical protein